MTPNSATGASQTFSFVFTDSLGAADINTIFVGFGTSIWGANSCFLQLYPNHTVSLADDATVTWMTPITLGSSTTTQNSQCTLNGALSSVALSGNTFTLNLGLTYQAGFSGTKNIYASALSNEGLNSTWLQLGTYTVSTSVTSVAAPAFSPVAGTYGSAQSVGITTSTSGASIRYTTDGSTPSETVGTLYSTPLPVNSNETVKAIAYETGMTDSAVVSAVYTINIAASSNSAQFVKMDASTQGSWTGVYGSSGYNVIGENAVYPSGLTVAPLNETYYLWAGSTTDVRALQTAPSSSTRVAATWDTYTSFTIGLAFNDSAQHQLAIYSLDWDQLSRSQTISILDGTTNAVLDSRNVTSFGNGQYLVWKVSGQVIVKVTNAGPYNAVISGIFLDPGTAIGGVVATPVFSPVAGTYSSAQSVGITTTTPGASIRFTTDGSTPTETTGTLYSVPIAVSSSETIKAIAYETLMTDSAVASAAYTINIAASTNSAQFVKTDLTTQGTWTGVYGSSGYNVIGANAVYPGDVTVTPTNESYYLWANSTTDLRDLQTAPSSTPRVAATWFSASSLSIDIAFSDTLQHQLAIYSLDWDQLSRSQTISILDGTSSAVLDSRSVTNFGNGQYLVWKVSGHVIVKVTNTGPYNAVISGIFLDPNTGSGGTVATPVFSPVAGTYSSAQSVGITSATSGASIRYTTDGSTPSETTGIPYSAPFTVSTSETVKAIAYQSGMTDSAVASAVYTINIGTPTNSAQFLKTDATTQGSWTGVYGSSGYNVIGENAAYPSDLTVTPGGETFYLWAGSTTDARALQTAPSSTARVAATWDTYTSFTVGLAFNDTAQHQIAIYSLDWDRLGRTQTISILDGTTNAVLDSRSITNFGNGLYLVWKVTGHVILQVTNTGPNAVISGLFFD